MYEESVKRFDRAETILKLIKEKYPNLDRDQFCSLLTHFSAEDLIKHSKRLTFWTIVIAFTSIALILSTIAEILFSICPL